MWILDLKFLRDFAAGFLAEDLFAADPAVFIHEVEPAFDYLKTVTELAANATGPE